jgi:hypothetical protein
MKSSLKYLVVAFSAFLLAGCLPVLVGGAIYNSTAKREAYSKYVTESQKNNTDREVKGLKPLKVMSYEEWETGQSLTAAPETEKAKS